MLSLLQYTLVTPMTRTLYAASLTPPKRLCDSDLCVLRYHVIAHLRDSSDHTLRCPVLSQIYYFPSKIGIGDLFSRPNLASQVEHLPIDKSLGLLLSTSHVTHPLQ